MPAFDEREEEEIDTDTDTDINISDEEDGDDGTVEAKAYLRICAMKRVVPVQVRARSAFSSTPPSKPHTRACARCSPSVTYAPIRNPIYLTIRLVGLGWYRRHARCISRSHPVPPSARTLRTLPAAVLHPPLQGQHFPLRASRPRPRGRRRAGHIAPRQLVRVLVRATAIHRPPPCCFAVATNERPSILPLFLSVLLSCRAVIDHAPIERACSLPCAPTTHPTARPPARCPPARSPRCAGRS